MFMGERPLPGSLARVREGAFVELNRETSLRQESVLGLGLSTAFEAEHKKSTTDKDGVKNSDHRETYPVGRGFAHSLVKRPEDRIRQIQTEHMKSS